MHIGIDARFLGAASYGLAQYSESLLVALSRHDPDNRYTIFVNAGLRRRLKVGENFRQVPIAGAPLSGRGLGRLWWALRQTPLDLLHVHFPLVPPATQVPTVITVHDVVPFVGAPQGRVRAWDRLGHWVLYPRTMRRARWIVCVSHATRQRLIEIYPEAFHKTIVLRSGVEDLYRMPTAPTALALIRSRLRLPDRYILYSGSTGEAKNVPAMIRAFAQLLQRDPRAADYRFVLDIAGDRRDVGIVRRTVERCGVADKVITLTGTTADERHVLFEEAALLFIASKEEGFGLPVLKAQLCRVPVLAADAGGLPEVCGDGALLVDPDDPDEMTAMLGQALFDEGLRQYLAEKGHRNALGYSWEDTARQVRQIYELLC